MDLTVRCQGLSFIEGRNMLVFNVMVQSRNN